MKKIIPILLLSIITIAIFVYIFFPPPWVSEDIEGCMDPTSSNYNPNATIDDESCESRELPNEIKEKIDFLSEKDWDIDDYTYTKNYIKQFYHSNSKSEGSEEYNALHTLDMVYMRVLNEKTENLDDCLSNSENLKKEVTIFYNKYESESNEIRKARSWFTTEEDIHKYKKDVASLITKRYNKNSYTKLKNNINTLKNSNNYKVKIKKCRELSSIIDNSLKGLSNFKRAHEEYKEFEKIILKFESRVAPYWKNKKRKYMNYKWYKKDIEEIDNLIREKQKIEYARVEELLKTKDIRNRTERKEAINDINLKYDKQVKNIWNKLQQKQMR